MGLDEYIPASDGASLIEWPEMAKEAMPRRALEIELSYGEDGEGRLANLTALGGFDEARLDALRDEWEAGK